MMVDKVGKLKKNEFVHKICFVTSADSQLSTAVRHELGLFKSHASKAVDGIFGHHFGILFHTFGIDKILKVSIPRNADKIE